MLIEDLEYSNSSGFLDKAKGVVNKVKDGKALSTAKDLIGKINVKSPSSPSPEPAINYAYSPPPTPKKEKGMSTPVLIGIGVGGLAVVGLLVWALNK